jgi:lipopolysaccharide export system permease protein
VFVYRQKNDRLDVTTALKGSLEIDGADRYIRLNQGFEVEGPTGEGRDYRLMRYASNDVRLPASNQKASDDDPELLPTTTLLGDPRKEARAQLHFRIAPPLLALAFALLAVPLARGAPRQARAASVLLGFLGYMVSIFLMLLGTSWIAKGKTPVALGLWWLVLPLLGFALWSYLRDGRVRLSALQRTAAAVKRRPA